MLTDQNIREDQRRFVLSKVMPSDEESEIDDSGDDSTYIPDIPGTSNRKTAQTDFDKDNVHEPSPVEEQPANAVSVQAQDDGISNCLQQNWMLLEVKVILFMEQKCFPMKEDTLSPKYCMMHFNRGNLMKMYTAHSAQEVQCFGILLKLRCMISLYSLQSMALREARPLHG